MPTKTPLRIVIEGIGDVVQTYYVGQLKKSKEDKRQDILITFVDDSRFWKKDPELTIKFKRFKKELIGWADYIDKSTDKGRKKYENLRADVVFISTPDFTHVELAMSWLQPASRCGRIFIEKPLDSDLQRSMDLLLAIKQNDQKVRTLDHYRARVLPVTTPLMRDHMLKDLGGRISGFSFYFLENGSGPPRIGPIENELRVRSVSNGLILDMMPHVPAILSYFGLVETIRVAGLKAGRYTYIAEDGKKRIAAIKKETFAHVRFRLFDHRLSAPPMQCDAYIGKGIRGVKSLGLEGNVKLLDIHGANGALYRLDLRTTGRNNASTALLINKNGEVKELTDLIHNPYEALIRRVVRHELDDPEAPLRFDLPIETAVSILLAIDQMRHPLKDREKPWPSYYDKRAIPTYHIGKGGRDAPYLEDVLETLDEIISFEE